MHLVSPRVMGHKQAARPSTCLARITVWKLSPQGDGFLLLRSDPASIRRIDPFAHTATAPPHGRRFSRSFGMSMRTNSLRFTCAFILTPQPEPNMHPEFALDRIANTVLTCLTVATGTLARRSSSMYGLISARRSIASILRMRLLVRRLAI